MSEELDRCDAFWTWFVAEEGAIRRALGEAAAARDYPAMQQLVERISAQLAHVAPGISLRLNSGATVGLAILSPVPELADTVRRVLARAPAIDGWTFDTQIAAAASQVIARDASGRELRIAYADVRFALLPPKPDGSTSVLFAIDAEFDPKGETSHLYLAVATELIKNAFGAVPPGMGSYALVPASWLGKRETKPVGELAAVWEARVR